jgi:hypothetical protein
VECDVCARRPRSLSVAAEDFSSTSSTDVARSTVAWGLVLMLIDDAVDEEDQDHSEVNPKAPL